MLFTGGALADLYRWVDPETGSVKFSSYPPPWLGDPAEEERSPKVEHIPERQPAPAAPPKLAPAGLPATSLDELDARRKVLIQQLSSLPGQADFRSGTLKQQLETFATVSTEMDKLDPRGADARRAEAQPLLDKLVGVARQLSKPPATAPR